MIQKQAAHNRQVINAAGIPYRRGKNTLTPLSGQSRRHYTVPVAHGDYLRA